MAMICQVATITREFSLEFEWHAKDVVMAKEDMNAHLVLALN